MLLQKIKELAAAHYKSTVEVRRHLHRNPELSFKEFNTSAYICAQLDVHGIAYTAGLAGTGIIAIIKGKNPRGKTVLLRGDMDALPITEENNVEYKSQNEGIMHACGHDVHSSCVLHAAIILKALEKEWEGTVKVMFQPGEEVLPGGASLMIEEGVLENPKVDNAIALHVFPSMEAGSVGFREGMYMASTDELYLTVNGKGGHAAMPGEYKNPLLPLAEIILAFEEEFMKRKTGGEIPTVVAFGKLDAQGATNVIPSVASAAGTFRTMDEPWREKVHARMQEIVKDVAVKSGTETILEIRKGYPFLVNDAGVTSLCKQSAIEYLGADKVEDLPLRMTAEDFAFVTQAVPSCFFRLGTGSKSRGITAGVHSPKFDIEEKAMETATGMLAWLAIRTLSGTI